MRVSILNVQVPFIRGGAEFLADSLAAKIRGRGHEVDEVKLPFKWYPNAAILDHMLSCRLLDTDCGQSDLTIALKFPAYLAPAHNKRLWLLHQHRQAYDLWGTNMYGMADTADNRALRSSIVNADNEHLREAQFVYTISNIVSKRLQRYNDFTATGVLYPPLERPELFQAGDYGDYFFCPSRLTIVKRQHIAVEAMRYVRSPFKLVLAGQADNEAYNSELSRLIELYGLQDKVVRLGWISEEDKARWMNNSLAVVFIPYDEDYGYVTVEAFHSHKAVLSFTDSGGVAELISDGETGCLAEPTPEALAETMEALWADRGKAREMGHNAGQGLERRFSWNNVLDRLLE